MSHQYNKSVKWLIPGMGIKRWFLIASLGLMILSSGLMLLTNNRWALLCELYLVDCSQDLLGWRLPSLAVDFFILFLGLAIIIWAMQKCFYAMSRAAFPAHNRALVDLIYERRQLDHGYKIVALGGGTGLSTLLRGLKKYTSNIIAIVSVSDDGGSSGRLREEMGMLPPGDLRNCMTALAEDETLISELFKYRFREGMGLEGHSFGNLFLAALTDMTGDFQAALTKGCQILATRGRVIPVTLVPTTLCATFTDGRTIKGESEIPAAKGKVEHVFLEPSHCTPPEEVFTTISQADCIILGPGSLYTSVIPNLLIDGVAEAIRNSSAPKIYVCNVMTQPGETDGYTAADHLEAIEKHVGGHLVDYVIVNLAPPNKLREKYQRTGAHPIKPDLERLRRMHVTPIPSNLVNEDSLVRHDSAYLAETIIELMANIRTESVELPAVSTDAQ